MSELKIFTNSNDEIRALHFSDDKNLTCHVIDREKTFGNFSDAVILGYKYTPTVDENGVEGTPIITPYMDKDQLMAIDAAYKQLLAKTDDIIYVNRASLEELIAFHKKALNRSMQQLIYNGIDIGEHHFSLTNEDQSNIERLVSKLNRSNINYVLYHADGEPVSLYTREAMMNISNTVDKFVNYHQIRINRLHRMVEECKRKRDVLAIQYNTPLTPELQREVDELYSSVGITGNSRLYFDKTVEAAERTSGEIYSNKGSMVELPSYDTIDNWCDLENWKFEKLAGNDATAHRYSIPVDIVDDDKLKYVNYGVGNQSVYTLSPIFHKIVITDNGYGIKEEYVTNYTLEYTKDIHSDRPMVYTDVSGNVALKLTITMGCLIRSEDDKINSEKTVYIVNTGGIHKIVTSEKEMRELIGVKEISTSGGVSSSGSSLLFN